jgi:two-component system cell cycle sensor histidine kinase/response regulator CckA
MGDRFTQPSQPKEVVRVRRLKRALERGTPPAFIPPATAASAPMPSSLSWNREETQPVRSHYLEQLFQSSPHGLSIVDTHDRIQCVNHAFQNMFGHAAEELVGQPIDSLILPPERAAEAHWMVECLRHGESISLETQRRHKDGTLIDVALTSAPLVIDGNITAWYAIYRDISQVRHTQALSSALYRIAEKTGSAHDLQQLFAAVHGIVDELTYARNFSIAIFDEHSQLLSFPYFVDEQNPAPTPGKLGPGLTERVVRTGQPLLCSSEVLRRMVQRGEAEFTGVPPLEWMGVPLKVGEHTFGALVLRNYSGNHRFTDRDKEILTFVSQQLASVIQHKRNEEALRRSEARYRSLVQTAVYGIYRSSFEGHFLDVNPALIGMLGYNSASEVLALGPEADIFVDPREHSRLIEEFCRSGRIDGFEVRWKRKDGSAITVRISGRAVSSADDPASVLEAIAEDITERRVLEDQFRQAQKMEAVGRLAGGIAHDFNNLLMVISGYTEVLLSQLDADHPLHLKAQAIQQASDRATTLTRQLLAFSRKQLLELKIVDVNAIVADMERLLRPLIGENIELTTRLVNGVGCTRADAGQLEQVIMNLVVNAKDAMPSGGKIIIRTDNATLDESYRREHIFIKPGPYIMIAIRDTGCGMDRETQARIFEPFFTTKEKGKGTGLGLSTVYGIIKQSGGYIFVQSEVGRGTNFTIYLPRVDEPLESPGATPASFTSVGGSETVLLVEDEESVRQLVRETLEARGYRVLEAENGQAGLTVAQQHQDPIHLIITDVVMPGMSGHQLVQQLLQLRPDLKVLYLSGYTEDVFAGNGIADNSKAFLQKPFTLQSLSRKVREVLGQTGS